MSARILVIEDDQASRELMTYLLQAFGHTPLCAHDGAEGLEIVRREAPDLVICDIQLPQVDGYEVARQLKGHPVWRAMPLVAVTASAMARDRDKALVAGFDGYLTKPLDPETFVQQMEAFLAARQSKESMKEREAWQRS
jgi:two-component system cell cycle response regulator